MNNTKKTKYNEEEMIHDLFSSKTWNEITKNSAGEGNWTYGPASVVIKKQSKKRIT